MKIFLKKSPEVPKGSSRMGHIFLKSILQALPIDHPDIPRTGRNKE